MNFFSYVSNVIAFITLVILLQPLTTQSITDKILQVYYCSYPEP